MAQLPQKNPVSLYLTLRFKSDGIPGEWQTIGQILLDDYLHPQNVWYQPDGPDNAQPKWQGPFPCRVFQKDGNLVFTFNTGPDVYLIVPDPFITAGKYVGADATYFPNESHREASTMQGILRALTEDDPGEDAEMKSGSSGTP